MLIALVVAAQVAVPTPAVVHNHFFVTVDRRTYAAIRNSRWLRERFGRVTESTHSSGNDTWTGLYVYGVGSYVEIFAANKSGTPGEGGLGLLTTVPGGADNVDFLFRSGAFGSRTERELMYIGSRSKQRPFAHIVSYGGQAKTNLSVWLMEYHAEEYAAAGVPVGSPESAIFEAFSRKRRQLGSRLMGDLQSVTLRPAGDQADLRTALELMGFRRNEATGSWRQGNNEVVVARPLRSAPKFAVTSARFSLAGPRPKQTHVENFGQGCVLKVYPDRLAEWTFVAGG